MSESLTIGDYYTPQPKQEEFHSSPACCARLDPAVNVPYVFTSPREAAEASEFAIEDVPELNNCQDEIDSTSNKAIEPQVCYTTSPNAELAFSTQSRSWLLGPNGVPRRLKTAGRTRLGVRD